MNMKPFISISLFVFSCLCSNLALAADTAVPSPRPFAIVALDNPQSIAVDRAGNLYVVDVDSGKIQKISPTGKSRVLGSKIPAPIGITATPDGTLFVADSGGNEVYRIAPGGAVTALSAQIGKTNFSEPISVAVDSGGNVFVANHGDKTILKITPAGVASIFAGKSGASGSADGAGDEARFNSPRGIAIDAQNNVYVADEGNSNIRKITPAGVVSTLAGTAGEGGKTDGTGLAASFRQPHGLGVDASGNVFVADTGNHCIRKITADGVVTTFAGQAGQNDNIDGAGSLARFNQPRGIAVDNAGNVFVADADNRSIREITPDGIVTTIARASAVTVAPASAADWTQSPIVPPRTGETERFDYSHAQTLDGWDGDTGYWSVKDGAFDAKGKGVQSNFLLTKKSFSDFRLTFSSQVIESDNHAGVCFWGDRAVTTNGKNIWAYRGPLLMFPGLGLWDYVANKNIPFDPSGKVLAKKIYGQHELVQVEMLAQGNRLRVAYNGQQVLDWRAPDPSQLKAGPIGLQLHGFPYPQEVIYKNVVIETFPKEDRLITVNPSK
jgi:sugar lactone lactonase YvrE